MSLWPRLFHPSRNESASRLSVFVHRIAQAAVMGRIAVGREARRRVVARNPGDPRMTLVQTVALDTRRRVSLLRCGEQHLLLLTGGASDVVIGWLPNETPPAPPPP